jgi:hypothetical protein
MPVMPNLNTWSRSGAPYIEICVVVSKEGEGESRNMYDLKVRCLKNFPSCLEMFDDGAEDIDLVTN